MHLLISESADPSFNLALDEYYLTKSSDEFIILAINSQSVISGKHQCIHREINTRFIEENNIPVFRRITGGGTVFHDKGNLNYTFIMNSVSGKQVDFPKYTGPVIHFIESLGLKPYMEGSDIKVEDKKVSGNAEHIHRNRVLHHGTLLYDASLEELRSSLRKDTSCYVTKAVASRPSPVINLKQLIPSLPDTNGFMFMMADYFRNTLENVENFEIEDEAISEIMKLADEKYNSWNWNYAYGPEYFFKNSINIDNIEIKFCIHVREGIISEIVLNDGNYHDALLNKLAGLRHMPEDIRRFFKDAGIKNMNVFSFF